MTTATAVDPTDPADVVAETLRKLSTALTESGSLGWTLGDCAAVLEALESAVRPHRPVQERHYDGWVCALDKETWPCPLIQVVRDDLQETDQ